MRFVVAFYEIDRACGGVEEGGWWYDTGRLVRLHRVCATEARAGAAAARANRLLAKLQRGRRPVSSVAYTGGCHAALVFEGNPPPGFPEKRPHYK